MWVLVSYSPSMEFLNVIIVETTKNEKTNIAGTTVEKLRS